MSIMLGGNCVSQIYDAALAEEMRQVALDHRSNLLPCIPNIAKTQRAGWQKYSEGKYAALWDCQQVYGSSLITRPDSAPWIDRPDYWARWLPFGQAKILCWSKALTASLREATFLKLNHCVLSKGHGGMLTLC
jgi:hypothetical protein